MATLRDIRKRIRSVRSTRQITKAMKMVAAARLRKAQMQAEQSRPYAEKMAEMLRSLSAAATENLSHPFFERRSRWNAGTGHLRPGTCGAFGNLIRKAGMVETTRCLNCGLVCVGKRGHLYFRRRGWTIAKACTEFNATMNYAMVRDLVGYLTGRFISGETDEIYFIYTKFHSTSRTVVTLEKYLNIDRPEAKGVSGGAYIFEPNPDAIFSELLPRYAQVRCQAALADSFASEHATRMMAMSMATTNAGEMIDNLTLQYNRPSGGHRKLLNCFRRRGAVA
jgi:F-type H+-transporting ATPase subunit gamma